MKVSTPEISWHGKEAIFSIDVQKKQHKQPQRIATASLDNNIRIWKLRSSGDVEFLSNLQRHDKAVNVVRFSHDGVLLASAGDDSVILLWKLSDKNEAPNIFDDEVENKENWNCVKSLRGHLEDVNDLSWSHNDEKIVSGSVDHTTILWDVKKGEKLAVFSDAKHFIAGVAWDPVGKYVATMSCDRSMRIYNTNTRKLTATVNRMTKLSSLPTTTKDDDDDVEIIDDEEKSKESCDSESVKPERMQRMFHDETVVRRRLEFSSDGKLLIVPAGCLSDKLNAVYFFSRRDLTKPVAYLPIPKEAPCLVSVCPLPFTKRREANGGRSPYDLDYRHVYAVATVNSILLYDTQHSTPFGMVSNIHYESITDIRWSPNGKFIVVSSRDGFCSLIHFEEGEIGEVMEPPAIAEPDAKMEDVSPPATQQVVSDTKENIEKDDDDDVMLIEDDDDSDVMEVEEAPPCKAKTETKVKSVEKHHNNKTEEPPSLLPKKQETLTNGQTKKEPRRIFTTLQPIPAAKAPTNGETKPAPTTGGKRRIQLITLDKP